jgi:hypothetical protein
MKKHMCWIKVDGEGYFPAFRCSCCNTTIVVEDECFELPSYCKFCESEQEGV